MSSDTLKRQKKFLFSQRLNQGLDQLEYPPLHLGRIERLKDVFQVSQTAARKWITGLSLPHYERRKLIAKKLGLCFEWLEQGIGEMLPSLESHTMEKVPSYPLLNLHDLEKNHFESVERIPCPGPVYSSAFVMHQTFSEMSSRFPLGCLLVVDRLAPVKDGDFIILRLNRKEKNVLFRTLKHNDQGCFFYDLALPTSMTPIFHKDEILGRVIQVIINI